MESSIAPLVQPPGSTPNPRRISTRNPSPSFTPSVRHFHSINNTQSRSFQLGPSATPSSVRWLPSTRHQPTMRGRSQLWGRCTCFPMHILIRKKMQKCLYVSLRRIFPVIQAILVGPFDQASERWNRFKHL